MENVKQIVDLAYREITKKGYFDIVKGNKPVTPALKKPMDEVIKIMTDYVNESSYGCCFVFSSYIIDVLNKNNINAHMILSIEDTGFRASVLYQDGCEFYIANPVEDIEYFTIRDIKPEDRAKYYVGDTSTMLVDGVYRDDSRYTVEEFAKKYGELWVMEVSKDKTLEDSLNTYNKYCVSPQDKSNVDINTFKKMIKQGS